jgi:hypothetical protein
MIDLNTALLLARMSGRALAADPPGVSVSKSGST